MIGLMFFCIAISFLILIGAGVWLVFQSKAAKEEGAYTKNKEDLLQGDVDKSLVTENLLNFKDIRHNVIDMGNHNYRAVIECSSVNYHLKTPTEKEVVHLSFKKFLDSLTFPISINVQTRTMDMSKRLSELEKELTKTKEMFPKLSEYANIFLEDMTRLPQLTGTTKEKRKYIIIPYNETSNLKNLTEEEKHEEAQKNLSIRVAAVRDRLGGLGIKCTRLTTPEIVELLYYTLHKDGTFDVAEALSKGEYSDLFVQSNTPKNNLSYDAYVDWVLYDAQTRISSEILTEQTPARLKKEYQEIIQRLSEIRDSL